MARIFPFKIFQLVTFLFQCYLSWDGGQSGGVTRPKLENQKYFDFLILNAPPIEAVEYFVISELATGRTPTMTTDPTQVTL